MPNLDWKKILLVAGAGALTGSVGQWIQSGPSYPFTPGNILIPAGVTMLTSIAALFVKRPQDPK